MSFINVGSTAAFNAFLSVSVVALMATYMISIGCVLYKRLSEEPLPPARWKMIGRNSDDGMGGLGRYGVPINIMALVYSLWAFFWSFWPNGKDVTPITVSRALVEDAFV